LRLFKDVQEKKEVEDLLVWWNRFVIFIPWLLIPNYIFISQVFPTYSTAQPSISKNSTLARIKEKRRQQAAAAELGW
jgi:hypothetical protein